MADKTPEYPCDSDAGLGNANRDYTGELLNPTWTNPPGQMQLYTDGNVKLGCFHRSGHWTKDGIWKCDDCIYALVPNELLIEWQTLMQKTLENLQMYKDILERKHA